MQFKLNKSIVNNCYTKCVGSDKRNLQILSKTFRHKSPTQVFIGHMDKTSSGFINKKEVFFYENDRKSYNLLEFSYDLNSKMNTGRNEKCFCGSEKNLKSVAWS